MTKTLPLEKDLLGLSTFQLKIVSKINKRITRRVRPDKNEVKKDRTAHEILFLKNLISSNDQSIPEFLSTLQKIHNLKPFDEKYQKELLTEITKLPRRLSKVPTLAHTKRKKYLTDIKVLLQNLVNQIDKHKKSHEMNGVIWYNDFYSTPTRIRLQKTNNDKEEQEDLTDASVTLYSLQRISVGMIEALDAEIKATKYKRKYSIKGEPHFNYVIKKLDQFFKKTPAEKEHPNQLAKLKNDLILAIIKAMPDHFKIRKNVETTDITKHRYRQKTKDLSSK